MIHNILKGYNGCIIPYGQTGSGKSYTMFGPEKPKTESDLGLVQRCCNYLFHKLNQSDEIIKWTFQISFLQIYKEHLTDLLESPSTTKELQIRTDVHTNTSHIHNLKYVTIHNMVEFLMHLNIALSHRIIRSHKISCSSSRSHLLLMINIKQTLGNNKVKISKLTFVDMSGSEDIRKALGSNPDPERMREAKCINLSVSALTTVINYLSRHRIPLYVSSVLTHILQHALGGNCKTTLIITASPHQFNRSETIRSMRFGMTAKTIKNNAKINYKNIDTVMNDNMVDKTVIDLEQVLDDIEPISYISSLCSDDNESKSNDSNYNINEHKVEDIYIDFNKKIIYEGYMCKEGKIFKTWRKRYFILNDNGIMAYYYKKGDENSINSFNVKTMNKIKTKIFGKTKQFGIELSTNKRVWKFLCIDEKDMKHWIKAISHFK